MLTSHFFPPSIQNKQLLILQVKYIISSLEQEQEFRTVTAEWID